MKTISRYIMTLALLITAATGAWAEDPNAVTALEIDATVYSGWKSIDGKLFKASELPGFQAVTEDQAKSWTGVPSTGIVYLYYEFVADGHVKYVRFVNGVYEGSYEDNDLRCYDIYEDIAYNGDKKYFYTTGPAPSEPDVEVTTNAAEEGATFTEASFQMPAFDATAEYELVRDMSVQMTATMGDGTDGVRYRVKKAQQGEGYEPADLNMMQVLALVAVNDGIEQKALTLNQDFFCRIYKLDEQTLQPVGDGMLLSEFNFAPGLYALKAFAQDGSDYDGETALSNTFKLFQGYEVEIAAGEYATFYKEENLYVEDEDAELYTITSVGTETATAAPLTVAKAYTPILVKNKGAEKKVILLIPTETEGDNVDAAPEFIGTLEATTIAASSENQNNYAFNGLQFVWVKNAIEIAANKAWLSINTGVPSARGITLVFDETTKIANTNITNITNGNWYDLNGRKLNKMPTKKGVYILNGKKVVVK